jgi:hypothetical protein
VGVTFPELFTARLRFRQVRAWALRTQPRAGSDFIVNNEAMNDERCSADSKPQLAPKISMVRRFALWLRDVIRQGDDPESAIAFYRCFR